MVARVYIRALRAISAGEEITVDYGRSYRMEECSKNVLPIQLTRSFKLSLERRKQRFHLELGV